MMAAMLGAVLLAAACSSSSSSASGTSSSAGSTSAGSTSAGSTSTGSTSTGSTTSTVVVPGVPTLQQLYKGSEAPPPPTSPPPAKGKSVWWISCAQSTPDCATRASAAQAAGKALGWDVHIADANLGLNNGYVTAMRTALAAHPSAIIQDAFSCQSDQEALQEAKQQGVLVMGPEALDCSDTGGPKLFSVDMVYNNTERTAQEYWQAFGKYSADYIIDESGGKAKVIANLGTGDPEFALLNEAFLSELRKCSGCTIVHNVHWTISDLVPNGPWINAFRTALIKYPDATAVYFPFDFMQSTLGGAQAIRTSGLKVTGFGGTGGSDSMDLIRQGLWTADTEAYSLPWMAWAAMDELNRAFNHQSAVPEGVGFVTVDSDHNLPPTAGSDYETKIDYVSAYKKAWAAG